MLTNHQLTRSLGNMAFGIAREIADKSHEGDGSRFTEREQQFQIDVTGVAGGLGAWETLTLDFTTTFYDAPDERDSSLEEPQMTFGFAQDSGPFVFLTAHVFRWAYDADGNFTGAIVRVGALDPTQDGDKFSGRLHLTFQGYGAPADDQIDVDGASS